MAKLQVRVLAPPFLLTLIALSVTAEPVLAATAHFAGVWSSVRYVAEAGDDLGMEVEIINNPQPVAVVTICEGSCYGGKAWPAVIQGDKITFSVLQDLVGRNGKPVKPLKMSFVGQLKEQILSVRMLNEQDVPEERLKRVAHPKPSQTAKLGCGKATC
jgi:hypothetical protein